ncbi:hypothetical protein EVAR_62787_1 [Eumeta japonica]|uniref:Uncharacterized protein n=1 Tax=Eumeta variegata TaxID=151549 RepID=A0A4C1Z5N8_EUMVA|nr:hypothetical protein EVAR_62787_1 [Eumeta japonica]
MVEGKLVFNGAVSQAVFTAAARAALLRVSPEPNVFIPLFIPCNGNRFVLVTWLLNRLNTETYPATMFSVQIEDLMPWHFRPATLVKYRNCFKPLVPDCVIALTTTVYRSTDPHRVSVQDLRFSAAQPDIKRAVLWSIWLQHESARLVTHPTLTEYRCEATASAVASHPVISESFGGSLPSPLDKYFFSKSRRRTGDSFMIASGGDDLLFAELHARFPQRNA